MKTTTINKVKVCANDRAIAEEKSKIEHSLRLINDLIEHYRCLEFDISDDELNALIKGNFQDSTIDRLATERIINTPKKLKEKVREEFVEDVMNYVDVFSTAYLFISSEIQVKNGKASICDHAFQKIEEHYTQYITDPVSIKLFEKHNALIKEINDLKEEINIHTAGNINSSHLVHFDLQNAYRPIPINYGN